MVIIHKNVSSGNTTGLYKHVWNSDDKICMFLHVKTLQHYFL